MELRAVIEALNSLKEPCHVTLYSDSQLYEKWHHTMDLQLEEKQLESEYGQSGKKTKICGLR